MNQRVALHILQKAGHSTLAVANGKQALEALERETFDLVLMDVQMPEMDGLEATAAIRATETQTGRRLPIIAMTAHAMKGDRERCLDAGMDDYVSKPVQPAVLLRAIESAVLDQAASTNPCSTNPLETALTKESVTRRVSCQLAPEGTVLNAKGNLAAGPAVVGQPVFDHQAALDRMRRGRGRSVGSDWPVPGRRPASGRQNPAGHRATRRTASPLRSAHALKGAAGCLGGVSAAAAALQLEEMGSRADLSQAAEALADVEREIQRLSDAISKLVLQTQP